MHTWWNNLKSHDGAQKALPLFPLTHFSRAKCILSQSSANFLQITSWQMVIVRSFFFRCSEHKFAFFFRWICLCGSFFARREPHKKVLNWNGGFCRFSADMNAFSLLLNINNDAHLFNSNFLCVYSSKKRRVGRSSSAFEGKHSRSNACATVNVSHSLIRCQVGRSIDTLSELFN